MKDTLIGLTTSELRQLAHERGHAAFRGVQLADWLYRKGVHTCGEMDNLPETLRSALATDLDVGRSRVATVQRSRDGTVKLLLVLRDGARIETVGLPYTDRLSCCVSTQVGCPMGCVFCATGHSGYVRDLLAGEIVDQVLTVQEVLRQQDTSRENAASRVDHVTFMGMGEPLLNYDATLKSLHLLNSELGIAARNLTVSTVGLVPGIRRLAREGLQITLAVSLHAPDDGLRRRLIPGMTRWGVAQIVDACRHYVQETGRRVTFEYCLMGGVNDAADHARQLADVLHGLNCHVNLILLNAISGLEFKPSSRDTVRTFRDILEDAGVQVTQRVERGADIDAACGQLRQRLETNGG